MSHLVDEVLKEEVVDWYKPGPSITEFHECDAHIRVLVGGRGCGKTTGIAVATIDHGWYVAGGRIYILRKSETSNKDTTLETFEQVFGQMGTAYQDTGLSLFKKMEGGRHFRIPSKIAVEKFNEFQQTRPNKAAIDRWLETEGNKWCSFIQFSGVPTSTVRSSRFRGFECSMLILVEADQFDREDVDMAVACLRWKSPDPSVCDDRGFVKGMSLILDTNPPGPNHWIAKWEEESLLTNDTAIRFWHIHTAENEQNLPPNYVANLKKQYAKNPAMYKRMIEGQYAEAFEGKPVLWAFRQDHVFNDLYWPKGAYLVRGWDFGTTHATVWSAYWCEKVGNVDVEYWWDMAEYFNTQSDTETQCRAVLRITQEAFPYWNDRAICAGVLDYCDPAGNAKKDTGRSISVLNTYEIYPGFVRAGLDGSIALYNRLLELQDPNGHFVYRIDAKNCPMLYAASSGGYRWPAVGEPGYDSGEPLKGPEGGNYDHIADASRYAKYNSLRLIRASLETPKAPVGPLARNTPVNRPRRWR